MKRMASLFMKYPVIMGVMWESRENYRMILFIVPEIPSARRL